jgi:hypothetical protein
MNEMEKSFFAGSIERLPSSNAVRKMILEKKALLISNAEGENWNQVITMSEQLNILQQEYLARIERHN